MGDFLGLISKRMNAESKLLGIDVAEQAIKAANDRYPNINFISQKFDGKLGLPDASFDVIVTIDVIECISDKNALINEFHRVLKPRGKVLAAHWDWDTMVYRSVAILEEGERLLYYTNDRKRTTQMPEEFEKWSERFEAKVVYMSR